MKTPQRATTLAALLAPVLAMAHTGTDAGAHHNLLDRLLYALSDLSLPALLAALAIWGAIFAASHAKKRKPLTLRETLRQDARNNGNRKQP